MIHASCITRQQSMCARCTHHGIGVESRRVSPGDSGWRLGAAREELQTRWPLLTYGEGEGEVLSLINHSFGDGPQGSEYTSLYVYVLSLSSFIF